MNTLKNLSETSKENAESKMPSPFFVWAIFALYNLLVIKGALLPASEFPRWFGYLNDKAVHFSEYWVLFLVALTAFKRQFQQVGKAAWLTAAGYGIFVGGLTEVLQMWVPGRSAEGLDFAANSAGVLAGCLTAAVFQRNR